MLEGTYRTSPRIPMQANCLVVSFRNSQKGQSVESLQVGDWVQAGVEITEPDFLGQALHLHAQRGGIGHVVQMDGEWATVTWERTGTTTDCHLEQLVFVSSAEAGRPMTQPPLSPKN